MIKMPVTNLKPQIALRKLQVRSSNNQDRAFNAPMDSFRALLEKNPDMTGDLVQATKTFKPTGSVKKIFNESLGHLKQFIDQSLDKKMFALNAQDLEATYLQEAHRLGATRAAKK